jgi:glycolate oxidase
MPMPTELGAKLGEIVGPEWVLERPEEMIVYECDAYTISRAIPRCVVLPKGTDQVSRVLKVLSDGDIPFVPRGAGTGLSGGALAVDDAVIVVTTRMTDVLEVDVENRLAVVETGCINLRLSDHIKPTGLHFAPDPSSQQACTIGGNLSENSGGPHCLKYGATSYHVLGVEVVLPDGEVVWLGGKTPDAPGYDLRGVFVGSEGTMGIATTAVVQLTPLPRHVKTFLGIFGSPEDASRAVSAIIAAGIIPAAMEMMDNPITQAVEAAFHFGFPLDAGAVLIVELDGIEAGVESQVEPVQRLMREAGAVEIRMAKDDRERMKLWAARKRAFGAIGRLAASYVTQDGVIPRSALPAVLGRILEISERYGLRIANVFHAGDGNLHPLLLFDERDPEQVKKVIAAGEEILRECIAVGGSITGEHGIGVEKRNLMSEIFSPDDMDFMWAVKEVFNPDGRCNPDKVFPTSKTCGEAYVPRKRQVA